MEEDLLLEPVKAYKQVYENAFKNNCNELFGDLVKKSGINLSENKKTSEDYRKKQAEADGVGKKISALKGWRVFLIVLCILSGIVFIYGLYISQPLYAVISFFVFAISLVLILALINPKKKELDSIFDKLSNESKTLLNKAINQMMPLVALFDNTMTYNLIRKTIPSIEIDDCFDMKRFAFLRDRFGYNDQSDNNTSVIGIMSGSISGNPYVFEKTLRHRMGMQRYTGSIVIHWTTTHRDSQGRLVTEHHSETLYAHVIKPKPFYSTLTRLVYGNDAAPNLSFSRTRTHSEQLSERELKSKVKSETKKIRKKAISEISSGFTEIGNEEFDALFGALDRDNEVEFRLLFTPLAQKNMLEIIKGGSPYGDDFNFCKSRRLNYLISDHAQSWNMDTDVSNYPSYDAEICRNNFINYNLNYFRNFYFDMAPVFSIPLYQHNKPLEYIYGKEIRNYTISESEVLANKMRGRPFVHPATATNAILKTKLVSKNGDVDDLSVTAYSYRTVHRVDVITVFGGDGHFHNVPVPWIEYIPITKQTEMHIKQIDMTEKEFRASQFSQNSSPSAFYHKLFATIGSTVGLYDERPDEKGDGITDFGDVLEDGEE